MTLTIHFLWKLLCGVLVANQGVIYTGGKGPVSLFIRLSWDLMCHASSAHLWWKLGCPSITVELLQSISYPSASACCATADKFA